MYNRTKQGFNELVYFAFEDAGARHLSNFRWPGENASNLMGQKTMKYKQVFHAVKRTVCTGHYMISVIK